MKELKRQAKEIEEKQKKEEKCQQKHNKDISLTSSKFEE